MEKYNFSDIEKKWQKQWKESGVYEPCFTKDSQGKPKGKKFYNLMMFPYPSAEGLHVGNMYAFTGTDVYGRMKRMQGHDVFEPIGLDGFGIHSENYAMKIGTHPMTQAKTSEERFYKQLEMVGNGFAWNERLETYNPNYYRWTQWVFLQLWKQGLAYRKKQVVNWCPSCKTVLSDEQAEGGKCERCGSEVEKKELEQWSFRITKYADRLLKNLDTIDWTEKVKIAQRNWIGKSEGALITFRIADTNEAVTVFTTRPDTLFGATYLVLSPEHELLQTLDIKNKKDVIEYQAQAKVKTQEERIQNKEKTGIQLEGISAINPATGQYIPVWISDYVLSGYGTGAIMAVPAHDERDFAFAQKFGLKIVQVIKSEFEEQLITPGKHVENILERLKDEKNTELPFAEKGILINSGEFDGLTSDEAKIKITEKVGGKLETQFRLRDWIISRQRYWGAPIPMIYCDACAKAGKGEQSDMPGWFGEKEENLPVELPFIEDFRPQGTGVSPLATNESFYKTTCPHCGAEARRETDVSDTFLDSAWYYLRYPNVGNDTEAWNKEITKTWCPVDMYIGGAEHSVLHLLYVRFVAMALHDAGLLDFEEPFPKFRAHGLLIKDGAKMSKSKGNVINPDEYVARFGADTLRMYLMFLAPFEQGGDFRDAGILGIVRFLERAWKVFHKKEIKEKISESLDVSMHKAIKKVTEDIESLHYNTAISALMVFLNDIETDGEVSQEVRETFLKLIAPFAPHIAEELWHEFENNSVHISSWPTYDASKLHEGTVSIVIQVNGKLRGTIAIARDASEDAVEKIARADERISEYLKGNIVKKIFVPNRLMNFVVQ